MILKFYHAGYWWYIDKIKAVRNLQTWKIDNTEDDESMSRGLSYFTPEKDNHTALGYYVANSKVFKSVDKDNLYYTLVEITQSNIKWICTGHDRSEILAIQGVVYILSDDGVTIDRLTVK